jgi:hypothetical protein
MDGKTLWCTLLAFSAALASSMALPLTAADPSDVRVYTSPHFELHTDLSAARASETLARMESMLSVAEAYWRVKPKGKIDCYLVQSQENWADAQLPHPLARISVSGVGGATVSDHVGSGRGRRHEATIYASTTAGVVEHEVVHAYCLQAFGATGPDWYKEGMAEVMAFRGSGAAAGVQYPPERLAELRKLAPRSVAQVVGGAGITSRISQSFQEMLARRTDGQAQVALSQWTENDAQNTRQARQDYLWAWALCHFLTHHPRYSARFRELGESYLLNRDDSFERVFGPMAREMEFEYSFFLENVATGYRPDLCAWDWETKFRAPAAGETVRRRIVAAGGWQPSGLALAANRRYAVKAEGAWSTNADGPLTGADGDQERGRLWGAVMTDFRLGRPFPLSAQGTLTAPAEGNLYLRCGDAWDQLGDNRGEVTVHFTAQ